MQNGRDFLRNELRFLEAFSISDWIKAYGPVGCEASEIAERVAPFLADDADWALLAASQSGKPSREDLLALLIAECDWRISGLSLLDSNDGKSRAEMERLRDEWGQHTTYENGFSCDSYDEFGQILRFVNLARMTYPLFNECPIPKTTDGLNAQKTSEEFVRIWKWAQQLWDKPALGDDLELERILQPLKGAIPKELLKLLWKFRNKGPISWGRANLRLAWINAKNAPPQNEDQTIHSGLKQLQKELSTNFDLLRVTLQGLSKPTAREPKVELVTEQSPKEERSS